mgnify:CR=1 FL=1
MGLAELLVERDDLVDHVVLVEGDEASSRAARVERVRVAAVDTGVLGVGVMTEHQDVLKVSLLVEVAEDVGVEAVLLQTRSADTGLDVSLEARILHAQLGVVAVDPQRAQRRCLASLEHLHLGLACDLAVGDVLGGRGALSAIDRLGPARRVDGRCC